jgi:hypothetical protein
MKEELKFKIWFLHGGGYEDYERKHIQERLPKHGGLSDDILHVLDIRERSQEDVLRFCPVFHVYHEKNNLWKVCLNTGYRDPELMVYLHEWRFYGRFYVSDKIIYDLTTYDSPKLPEDVYFEEIRQEVEKHIHATLFSEEVEHLFEELVKIPRTLIYQ